MRVWIETFSVPAVLNQWFSHPLREGVDWNYLENSKEYLGVVTLYVRVWIETTQTRIYKVSLKSPSTWGCGLKHSLRIMIRTDNLSPSTWGCGLKHKITIKCKNNPMSPSTWGCGLKRIINHLSDSHSWVTLYVRVWIETNQWLKTWYGNMCHPLREGVDWNRWQSMSATQIVGVTLYVRVWIET